MSMFSDHTVDTKKSETREVLQFFLKNLKVSFKNKIIDSCNCTVPSIYIPTTVFAGRYVALDYM